MGWKSARGVLAAKAGISFSDASRLVAVGEAIRPNVAASGDDLPADRPHVATAIGVGDLSLQIAQLMDETLGKLETRLERDLLDDLERTLVREWCSGRYSVAAFTAHCHEIVDQYDPATTKQRDDVLRRQASIRETWLRNGMLRVVAELDPEAAAFYLTGIRSRTNPRRPVKPTDDPESPTGNVTDLGARRTAKHPTPMEAKVYAFIGIMRDAVKAENGTQAGVDTTILVRIDLDALLSGIGSATIDGIPKPISASAARRLAAEANLIPQVLDRRSQLLDQGESKREFTKAQRYAILANHDRCAFPRCDIPSSMLEIHHVDGWKSRHEHGEGTDLHNGLPLCGFHNRLMEDGWDIRFDENRIPWYTPPASLDPGRAPVRGSSLIDRRAA